MTDALALPGYRRAIRIVPAAARVTAMLEDDIHAMAVMLHHAGGVVTRVEPDVVRAPWSTCPGAAARLVATFAGRPLAEVTARREKAANCTHLHDLAVLAAAHAGDAAPTLYEVAVSDPIAGERMLGLRRDGATALSWTERDGVLTAPTAVAGHTLPALREAIAAMPAGAQEAARLLRWAAMVAHARTVPMERQSNAMALPPSCYTFQPDRAPIARRIGKRYDFSAGGRVPLAVFGTR